MQIDAELIRKVKSNFNRIPNQYGCTHALYLLFITTNYIEIYAMYNKYHEYILDIVLQGL